MYILILLNDKEERSNLKKTKTEVAESSQSSPKLKKSVEEEEDDNIEATRPKTAESANGTHVIEPYGNAQKPKRSHGGTTRNFAKGGALRHKNVSVSTPKRHDC
jgi:hypothetical protein